MISIGLFWLVVALVVLRWMNPGGGDRALPDATRKLEGEVARLRDEVDRLSGRVDRLLDEQSYLLRLLDAGEGPPALPGQRPEAGGTPPADQTPNP